MARSRGGLDTDDSQLHSYRRQQHPYIRFLSEIFYKSFACPPPQAARWYDPTWKETGPLSPTQNIHTYIHTYIYIPKDNYWSAACLHRRFEQKNTQKASIFLTKFVFRQLPDTTDDARHAAHHKAGDDELRYEDHKGRVVGPRYGAHGEHHSHQRDAPAATGSHRVRHQLSCCHHAHFFFL